MIDYRAYTFIPKNPNPISFNNNGLYGVCNFTLLKLLFHIHCVQGVLGIHEVQVVLVGQLDRNTAYQATAEILVKKWLSIKTLNTCKYVCNPR